MARRRCVPSGRYPRLRGAACGWRTLMFRLYRGMENVVVTPLIVLRRQGNRQ